MDVQCSVFLFSQYDNYILLSWKSCDATSVSGAKPDSEARISTYTSRDHNGLSGKKSPNCGIWDLTMEYFIFGGKETAFPFPNK